MLCLVEQVLTFLYERGDGQQGDDEAEAAVDAQKNLIEQTSLGVSVENTHEDYGSDSNAEQNQSHKGQCCVPQAVILHS